VRITAKASGAAPTPRSSANGAGAPQELEETSYWLELLAEAEILQAAQLSDLMRECDELIAILTTCVKNVKGRGHD
jgi:four helix bundle protein